MCLVAFAWRRGTAHPLVLVGNRDEFHVRPAAPMHWWQSPPLLAGRDLRAGGTWFATAPDGRFAALTNLRGGPRPPRAPSRGELIPGWLAGDDGAWDGLAQLATRADAYASFSLLAGDGDDLVYLSNADAAGPRRLARGTYALGNGPLDSPWPKLRQVRAELDALLARPRPPDADALFAVLDERAPVADDELPDTGVGTALERMLSPAFIVGPEYGTRCTTALAVAADGMYSVAERAYDATGRVVDRREYAFRAAAASPHPAST